MKVFIGLMTNLCGLFTTGIMAYGVWHIIKGDLWTINEITFLMFVGFILTALFGSGKKEE
jgi:uncharacterized membrane protein YphA (DoxX/SURF4 family)